MLVWNNLRMSMTAHWWTVAPKIRRALHPPSPPPSQPWALDLEDAGPHGETVRLSGHLHFSDSAERAVVAIHGLGGCTESEYMVRLAKLAPREGFACLRLNLRGSDRQGNDFYHAGLSGDLHAALKAPELAVFRELYLLGFSMGGHVALRAATEEMDPRVRAVAAVCAPLDLAPCADSFDRPSRWLYRRYVMSSLVDIYRAVAARRPVALPVEEATHISRIREWDEKIVAPRWGFDGPDDYYARASVASRLGELRIPALLVQAAEDPLVPEEAVRPALDGAPGLTVHWMTPAGHMGFPGDLDLGVEAPPGLEPQVLGWLAEASS
jgi:predicted alpha/beta-fold hydrolase